MCKKIYYRLALLFFTLLSFFCNSGFARTSYPDPEPEELWVEVRYKSYKSTFFSIYLLDTSVYLPVKKIFDYLQIYSAVSADGNQINGYINNEENNYLISFSEKIIRLRNITYPLKESDLLIRNEHYLKAAILEEVFGLKTVYDKKDLSVKIISVEKIPLDLFYEREIRRSVLFRKPNLMPVEFEYRRERGWFRPGILNWGISYIKSPYENDLFSYSLGFGSEIIGGDFQAFLNSSTKTNINWNNIPWRWRFVDQKTRYFKQLLLGEVYLDIHPYFSVKGLQITNSLLYPRDYFSMDSISGKINPEWESEIYSQGELLNFKKTDSSGSFGYRYPMVYGLNTVKEKYYGLNGEQYTKEQIHYIPYSILPPGEFEYTITMGRLKYSFEENILHLNLKYGINKTLGINGGILYVEKQNFNPFLNIHYRLLNNLYLSGEYYLNQNYSLQTRFYTFSNIQASFDFKGFIQNSFFNPGKQKYQSSFIFFMPLDKICSSSGLNFYMNNYSFENYGFTLGNLKFFTVLYGLNAGFELQSQWTKYEYNYNNSYSLFGIDISRNLPLDIYFQSRFNFNLKTGSLQQIQVYLNKNLENIGRVYLSVLKSNSSLFFSLNFHLSLPFTESNSGITSSLGGASFMQSASGAIAFDYGSKDVIFFKENLIGKGNITMIPFLDENNNGKRESSEREISSNMEVAPITSRSNSRLLRVSTELSRYINMNPYSLYQFKIDPLSLKDPLWKPRYSNILIETDPNNFKPVYLPVCYTGAVSGSIKDETDGITNLNAIKIKIRNRDDSSLIEAPVFNDGSFYIEGVLPGKYCAFLDSTFLLNRKLFSSPDTIQFEVRSIPAGDIFDKVYFLIRAQKKAKVFADLSGQIILYDYRTNDTLLIEVESSMLAKCAVEISNEKMNIIRVTDSTGKFSFADIAPGKWTLKILDRTLPKNYKPEKETFTLEIKPNDSLSLAIRIIPEKEPVKILDISRNKPIIKPNITKILYLEEKSIGLQNAEYLNAVANYLKVNPGSIIRIDGHTDNMGSMQDKQMRSERKALRIRSYLNSKGIKNINIFVRGWADRQPLNPNYTQRDRAKNNRVEIRIEK